MIVRLERGLFVAENGDRATLKSAGFRFCGGICEAKWKCARCIYVDGIVQAQSKAWFTDRPEIAARLAEHCDAEAKAALAPAAERQALSAAATTDYRPPAPAGQTYRPFQAAGVEFVLKHVWPRFHGALIGDEMGLGKGQPVDSLLPVPDGDGWKKIGELKPGDRVFGSNGKPTKVTGVFLRGRLPVYRVHFSDGASLVVDGDHLWALTTANDRHRGDSFRIRSTHELARALADQASDARYAVPQVQPLERTPRNVPLDPYILGVLLGDGHLASPGHAAQFTPGDLGVPAEVERRLPVGCALRCGAQVDRATRWSIVTEPQSARNPVLDAMRHLGLDGVSAAARFVPHDYLLGSAAQRLALLQGLMDTDGELRKGDGHVEFDSASERLADAVVEIVESLGGTARKRLRRDTGYRDADGERVACLPSHRVTIAMPAGISPFLTREGYASRAKYLPVRIVRAVESAGEADVVCIAVEAADSLYVAGRHVVTHNTVQALGLVNADQSIRRVLIICPKSLQLNWFREADKWLLPKQEPWRCYVSEETAPIPAEANLCIVNYDKLVGQPGRTVGPSLVAHGKWDLIVVDEAHYCKNPKAQRTEVVLRGLKSSTRRLLFLTGTPIENRPVEIHPILEACAPEEFPFWPFVKRYADAHEEWIGHRRQKRVWKFDGHGNLEELNARLRGTVMVRRLKRDVLKELPPKVRTLVELPNDDVEDLIEDEGRSFRPHEEAIVSAMALDLAGTGEPGYAGAVAAMTSKVSAAFTELSAIRHALGLAKVKPALEWLEDALASTPKILIFAHHHDVIDLLVRGLEEYGPVKIDGRDSIEERDAAVTSFQGDAAVRVFVGQTSAAGVGLTLTAASTVVFVESDWVPGKISQAEDRAHRIGQTDSVNVYHLVFNGSLDARMLQVVLEKQAVQDAALDSEVRVRAAGASTTGPVGSSSVTEAELPAKRWPEATAEERAAAKAALRFLSERCDGAAKEDGAGFSKVDTRIGKELAARSAPLTDGQVFVAKRLARKYQRQLPDEIKAPLLGSAA